MSESENDRNDDKPGHEAEPRPGRGPDRDASDRPTKKPEDEETAIPGEYPEDNPDLEGEDRFDAG